MPLYPYECPFCHTGFTNPDDYAQCVATCNNKRKLNAEAALRVERAKKIEAERVEKAKKVEADRAEISKMLTNVDKKIQDFNEKYPEEFPLKPIPFLGSTIPARFFTSELLDSIFGDRR